MDGKNGYDHEAKYLCVIRNWRHACGKRGLSALQWSQFNNDFLNYILDELILWHKQKGFRDFSLLEVNRYYSKKIVAVLTHCVDVQKHQ